MLPPAGVGGGGGTRAGGSGYYSCANGANPATLTCRGCLGGMNVGAKENDLSSDRAKTEKNEQPWFWPGFEMAGWVLVAAYVAYFVVIELVNIRPAWFGISEFAFRLLLFLGLLVAPAWVLVAAGRAIAVRKKCGGRLSERVLLALGVLAFCWHIASPFVLPD